jgi:hypothetical protein
MKYENPETKKTENWCFEDLPRKEQSNLLLGKGQSWVISLALALSDKLNDIGDQLDLKVE